MKNKSILLAITVCMALSAKSQQDVTPVMLAQARANIALYPEKSFQSFRKYAEAGNPEAMNALGLSYSKGIGTKVDDKLAAEWFLKAGEAGYSKAWNNLGLAYKNGIGVQQDFVQAYKFFNKAARAGSPVGYYSVGYMLFKGFGCTQDYYQAVEWFRKGSDSGELGSTYMLGICLRNGYGVSRNADSARALLQKAAAAGYVFAPEELATATPENTGEKTAEPIDDTVSTAIALKKGMDATNDIAGSYGDCYCAMTGAESI